MISPWFTPHAAHWFSFLSLSALASLLGVPAAQGRHRKAITAAIAVLAAIGASLLIAGAVALSLGQPRHVILPFLISGTTISVAFGITLISLRHHYAQAELRRMEAMNL